MIVYFGNNRNNEVILFCREVSPHCYFTDSLLDNVDFEISIIDE